MSLITRCPACGTMFKVVPDQLRISDGWVRCGHCAEVFDASAHMQGDPETGTPAQSAEHLVEAVEPSPASVANQPETRLVSEAGYGEEPAARSTIADEPYLPDDLRPVVADDLVPEPITTVRDEVLDDVSFVRDARRKAFWRRPLVRAAAGLTSLLLLVALALQVAVQERDRLSALQPALRPVLEMLCAPLRCAVGPPRQIEAIVIDSSSFSKLRGDAYRLALTLKNQAGIGVAMPAIELTLTDGQDQPVLRRILMPADLGASEGRIEAASDWSGSFTVSVTAGSGAGRVAGYRLLAFYP